MRADDVDANPSASLICDDPYASYALIADAVHPEPAAEPGVHASAVVAETSTVAASASIGANACIGENTVIGVDQVDEFVRTFLGGVHDSELYVDLRVDPTRLRIGRHQLD